MCVCVCVCVCGRLRDLAAQDKLELQRMVKDLEKNASEFTSLKEHKDKVEMELQVGVASVHVGVA